MITAVETTTGAVDEASQLLGLIEAHEDTTNQAVEIVIADARYGSPNWVSTKPIGEFLTRDLSLAIYETFFSSFHLAASPLHPPTPA